MGRAWEGREKGGGRQESDEQAGEPRVDGGSAVCSHLRAPGSSSSPFPSSVAWHRTSTLPFGAAHGVGGGVADRSHAGTAGEGGREGGGGASRRRAPDQAVPRSGAVGKACKVIRPYETATFINLFEKDHGELQLGASPRDSPSSGLRTAVALAVSKSAARSRNSSFAASSLLVARARGSSVRAAASRELCALTAAASRFSTDRALPHGCSRVIGSTRRLRRARSLGVGTRRSAASASRCRSERRERTGLVLLRALPKAARPPTQRAAPGAGLAAHPSAAAASASATSNPDDSSIRAAIASSSGAE